MARVSPALGGPLPDLRHLLAEKDRLPGFHDVAPLPFDGGRVAPQRLPNLDVLPFDDALRARNLAAQNRMVDRFVAAPGGWGTNDELFEALVLIQTRTIRHFPVVLFGADHWRPFLSWSADLRNHRLVSQEELDLVTVTDDPDEAVNLVISCYRRECDHVEPA